MKTKQKGKIRTWKDDKGFGFITPLKGGEDVFFHISKVKHSRKRPSAGDSVIYTLTYDDKKRPRAINVYKSNYISPTEISLWIIGTFFTIIALFTFLIPLSFLILIAYVVFSYITFKAYEIDKTAAKRADWRIPEYSLHFLELLGGWPGALVAQNFYRHKNRKLSYQVVYWIIVIVNLGVLIWYCIATVTTGSIGSTGSGSTGSTVSTGTTGSTVAAVICQQYPLPTNWVDFPLKIVDIDKGREVVTLENVSGSTIHLDNWTMCSFRGSQQHPIAGDILPGEIKEFPNTGGNIWSNSEEDHGGLYNSANELISYWVD